MKKIKVSELPLWDDLKDIVVLGVNSLKQSVKVPLNGISAELTRLKNGYSHLPDSQAWDDFVHGVEDIQGTVEGILSEFPNVRNNADAAWQELFRGDEQSLTGRVGRLENDVADKQTEIVDTDDIINQGDGELALTNSAKRDLFNVLWVNVGKCGDKQFTSVDMSAPLQYECNGVRMTFNQAVEIFLWHSQGYKKSYSGAFYSFGGLTTLPVAVSTVLGEVDLTRAFYQCANLVSVRFSGRLIVKNNGAADAFARCPNLRSIFGELDVSALTAPVSMFAGCAALQDFKIEGLHTDLDIGDSPFVSLESLTYMVNNATVLPDSTVVVRVHGDVFAKLTDDTSPKWFDLAQYALGVGIVFSKMK